MYNLKMKSHALKYRLLYYNLSVWGFVFKEVMLLHFIVLKYVPLSFF